MPDLSPAEFQGYAAARIDNMIARMPEPDQDVPVWGAVCRCGWEAGPFTTQGAAAQASVLHTEAGRK